ncbi:MAG: killer suppression protein [Armatimonadota bacterium]
MDFECRSNKLRKVLDDPGLMKKRYGGPAAKRLQKRIMELWACEALADMRQHKGARLHRLRGARDGQWAVDVDGARRLIFKPSVNPVPMLPDGGIDESKITRIVLLEVEDYHDG